jgi:hypothetical protein
MLSLLFYLLYLAEFLPWLAPMAVSSLTGAAAGFGSFRFGQGQLTARVDALERSSGHTTEERGSLVTRHEFDLLREDIREIRTDMRELRRTLTK